MGPAPHQVMSASGIRRLVAIAALSCCFGSWGSAADKSSGKPRIVPGLRVGAVSLGERLEKVHEALGTPTDRDAAMGGRLTEVWLSRPAPDATRRPEALEISFQGPGAGGDQSKPTVVVQIRATSPYLETASGVSTDSSVAQIRRAYPRADRDLDWEQSLPIGSDNGRHEGLVDRKAGIAFELRAGATAHPAKRRACVAIHVFSRNSQPAPMGPFNQGSR